jgi:rhodanese-related sulfurtransferase
VHPSTPNHNLTGHQDLAAVDLYRYDEAWELQPTEAVSQFWKGGSTDSATVLIDLRKPDEFIANQVPGSYNLPLQNLSASTPSPFFDAVMMEKQWKELDAMFSQNTISAYDLVGKKVGVICYNGDTARVATSVLRAKGIAASSIKGGYRALMTQLPSLQTTGRVSFQQWSETPAVTSREMTTGSLLPELSPSSEVLVGAP